MSADREFAPTVNVMAHFMNCSTNFCSTNIEEKMLSRKFRSLKLIYFLKKQPAFGLFDLLEAFQELFPINPINLNNPGSDK